MRKDLKQVNNKKQEKMDDIIRELKEKMLELDHLKIKIQKRDAKKITATKTKEMLEEIIVPPLELIKEQRHKKS